MSQKRLIQPNDLFQMIAVESPRLSPDGRWIAYVQMTRKQASNSVHRSIWVISVDGSQHLQLTAGDKQDRNPTWTPDSAQIVFVSNRHEKPQLYRISLAGGEAQRLTQMPNGVGGYPALSADGRYVAFLSGMSAAERRAEDAAEPLPAYKAPDPYVFDHAPVDLDFNGRYAQIYVLDLHTPAAPPRRLTDEDNHYESPIWLADRHTLISSRSRKPQNDAAWLYEQSVSIELASGVLTPLTGEGWRTYEPLPSPDGSTLLFSLRPDHKPINQQVHLGTVSAQGGEPRRITQQLDRFVELHQWCADSRTVMLTARHAGAVRLYQLDSVSGEVQMLTDETLTLTALHAHSPQQTVYAAFGIDGAHELYHYDGQTHHQLTHLNAAWLQTVEVVQPQRLTYSAPDGTTIEGWFMPPAAFDAAQSYPLAVNIHGGPSLWYGPSQPSLWLEWQHHAASGYAVFYCNPRGSSGYGEAFMLANHADWGASPAADVLAGVDAVLSAHTWLDPQRLAITGGSYGGYLTAWIISHDDRFAAAVTQRGPYNLESFHGTTDLPIFISSNMTAEPWEAPHIFRENSPIHYTQHINTPLLILHSLEDSRVHVTEAIQLFTSLKRQGKTVQLVLFPREGHELSRSGEPQHIIERLNRIVGWWDTYCKR